MEDVLLDRIKNALTIVKEGFAFRVEDISLGINSDFNFYVTGCTQSSFIENITKAIAMRDLNGIKKKFEYMVSISKELREFVFQKEIEFNLVYDYGNGGMPICSELNGYIKWYMDLE